MLRRINWSKFHAIPSNSELSRISGAALRRLSCPGRRALFATSWDKRTTLLFQVPESTVKKLLPEGWESAPLAQGVNLQVVFAESILVRYADGKTDGNDRVVTWVVPAKRKDGGDKGAMVAGGFISSREKAPGPYGAWSPAASAVFTRNSSTTIDGQPQVRETWEFGSDVGDTLNFEVEFEAGPLSYGKADSKVFSAVRDGFYRVYRIEQASETIPATDARIRSLIFRAKGPNLSTLFDGSERLVGVSSVPWFSRQIFLPK